MTCGKALAVAISSSAAAGGEAGVLSAMVDLLAFAHKMVWGGEQIHSSSRFHFTEPRAFHMPTYSLPTSKIHNYITAYLLAATPLNKARVKLWKWKCE
jgi:hypothetical protein